MTDITAQLHTIIGKPAPPGSTIEFYRTEVSGVTGSDLDRRTLLAGNPAVYTIVDGQPSPPITGLPGGPMFCRITAGDFRRTYPIVLPESGTVLLQNLLDAVVIDTLPPQVFSDIAALQMQLQDRINAAVAAATAQLQSSIAGSVGQPGQVLERSPSGAFWWSWADRYHDTYSNQY